MSGCRVRRESVYVQDAQALISTCHAKTRKSGSKGEIMIIENVEKKPERRKIADIIFKEDIYARVDPDMKLIARYAENIESILGENHRIDISASNILIDGYHRLKAIEKVHGRDYEIECNVHMTDNLDYIELESYAANTRHGKALSAEENIRNIRRLYAKGHELDNIQSKLGLSKSSVYNATKAMREAKKEEQNKQILSLYLRAENTQQVIANELDISQATISNFIKNSTSGKFNKEQHRDVRDEKNI